MIIDVHNHLGTSPDHTTGDAESLLVAMKKGSIDRSVIFTIDEPDRGETYQKQNQMIADAVQKYPEQFVGVCRVQPQAGKLAVEEMKRSKENGLVGVKLHPKSDRFSCVDVYGVIEQAGKFQWPVILHTDHHSSSKPTTWEEIFEKYPAVNFILTHGGKDDWPDAARIAESLKNVFLETSTLSYNRTRMLLERAGCEKIIFGSDYPYSHPYLERKKYELLISDPGKLEQVFSKNAKSLFGL